MQSATIQPPTPPAPPTPPDAPALRPTAVQVPGASIPLTGIPGTPEQVEGLRQRREILRDQLERATNRRENLVSELNREGESALPPEARVGVQKRLDLLDERILQIERDQALTERQLSNAPAEVLALAREQQEYVNRGVDEDEVALIGFMTFGAGVLLTMIIGRFRRRRSARAGARAGLRPGDALPDDPRIERLTQTVDAIAEEMERIGEGQRFVTQLLSRRHDAPAIAVEKERY